MLARRLLLQPSSSPSFRILHDRRRQRQLLSSSLLFLPQQFSVKTIRRAASSSSSAAAVQRKQQRQQASTLITSDSKFTEKNHQNDGSSSAFSTTTTTTTTTNNDATTSFDWRSWFAERSQLYYYGNPWDTSAEVTKLWLPPLKILHNNDKYDDDDDDGGHRLLRGPGRGHSEKEETEESILLGNTTAAEPSAAKSTVTTKELTKLEHASRHLIQLLQQSLRHGGRSSSHSLIRHDFATLERCHVVLNQLLHITASSAIPNATTVVVAGRAEHARAILECMELVRDKNNSNRRYSYPPPIPTRDIYQTVLQIYASSSSAASPPSSEGGGGEALNSKKQVPQWAYQLVQRMQQLYTQQALIELKPHAFHWNCVLLAWENAVDEEHHQQGDDSQHSSWVADDRATRAAQVFLENKHMLDASSYIIMLRICANYYRRHPRSSTNKAASDDDLVGAHVAIKIWQETIEKEQQEQHPAASGSGRMMTTVVPDLPSHFYAMFLQAIRSLPSKLLQSSSNSNNSSSMQQLRDKYFGKCFERARHCGKVNEIVLQEFLVHNRSPYLFAKYLKPYCDDDEDNEDHDPWNITTATTTTTTEPQKKQKQQWGSSTRQFTKTLLERIPLSWRDRADKVKKN